MFTVKTKTREEEMNGFLSQFNDISIAILENYKMEYTSLFRFLWKNESFTPQELFETMGNEAYKVFETAQKVILHIRDLDPTWIPPSSPYEFTVNTDGTVTIGDLIEV